jgi:hypothetical protein
MNDQRLGTLVQVRAAAPLEVNVVQRLASCSRLPRMLTT